MHVVAADILPAVHETIDGIRTAHPDNRGYAQETDVSDEGRYAIWWRAPSRSSAGWTSW